MTWASTTPVNGESRPRRTHHTGLVTLAGHWLGVNAIFNLVWGFGSIASPRIDHDHQMLGILHSAGWISILLGIMQLLVGAEAVMGNQLARWLGVALLTLNGVNQRFFITTYPFWSSLIILFDVVSIYALVRYGSRENLVRAETPAGLEPFQPVWGTDQAPVANRISEPVREHEPPLTL